jgi:hypothetical protein
LNIWLLLGVVGQAVIAGVVGVAVGFVPEL